MNGTWLLNQNQSGNMIPLGFWGSAKSQGDLSSFQRYIDHIQNTGGKKHKRIKENRETERVATTVPGSSDYGGTPTADCISAPFFSRSFSSSLPSFRFGCVSVLTLLRWGRCKSTLTKKKLEFDPRTILWSHENFCGAHWRSHFEMRLVGIERDHLK